MNHRAVYLRQLSSLFISLWFLQTLSNFYNI